jgi:hypothetical protein
LPNGTHWFHSLLPFSFIVAVGTLSLKTADGPAVVFIVAVGALALMSADGAAVVFIVAIAFASTLVFWNLATFGIVVERAVVLPVVALSTPAVRTLARDSFHTFSLEHV